VSPSSCVPDHRAGLGRPGRRCRPRRGRHLVPLGAAAIVLSLLAPAVGAAGAHNGLLRASPKLRDRIELTSTRVVAGPRLRGELIVTNRGQRPINLTRRCKPSFAVALTNGSVPPGVAFAEICSNEPFVIAPGTTRFRLTVATTYSSCLQPGGTSTKSMPSCLAGGIFPPLPPGRYRAVLVGDQIALPAPRPVVVTLLAPTG
jgi:hypothetical protein